MCAPHQVGVDWAHAVDGARRLDVHRSRDRRVRTLASRRGQAGVGLALHHEGRDAIRLEGRGATHPAVGCPGRGGVPEEPASAASIRGESHSLDMQLRGSGPSRARVGDAFEVDVVVTNTGQLALSGVVVAVRGHPGLSVDGDSSLEVRRLEPGGTRTLKATFIAQRAGTLRWSASGREQRGWAASGIHASVRALAPTEFIPSDDTTECELLDLAVRGELLDDVKPGRIFRWRVTLENSGVMELANVSFAWRGEGGISLPSGAKAIKNYEKLLPGERDEIVVESSLRRSSDPRRASAPPRARGGAGPRPGRRSGSRRRASSRAHAI